MTVKIVTHTHTHAHTLMHKPTRIREKTKLTILEAEKHVHEW